MKNTVLPILLSILLFTSTRSYAQRIAAGGRHSLAICTDGTVQSWGYNGFGQLGNGNTSEQHSGMQVIGLNGIIKVAGGLFHSLFIKNDGTVWACGRNPLGNLGDGTNTDRTIPVQVLGLTNIIQAAGGGEHSLFLKNDGTVWACGNNTSGQLGDGTVVSKNMPVQVSGLSEIIQVAAGAEFSLFLKKDGTVWACGHNGYGQFGNTTNLSKRMPVRIDNLSDVVQLSAGEWHSLFVKKDGSVLSCGRNQYGQLGDGTTTDKNTANSIATLSGVIQAEAGGIHSVFLKNDGTVWSTGLNSGGNNDGQLGDGTTVDKHTPVQVISTWGNGRIVRAEATREHSLFLTSDGSLWAAGRNNYGQLGYGAFSTSNSNTPVISSKVCNALTTSLNEIMISEEGLRIFPNPSEGVYIIDTEKEISLIEVFNISGEPQGTFSNIRIHNHYEINLSDYSGGVYLLRITDSDNRILTRKIKKSE